ncbi:carboxymuconolactone decarboxylase family protein [Chitinophaga oryziterrae]|uniref:Carboxymuconolactone decarboxylase family protein n=1 Tax=Chitinophaga oryziterrae TaxID=1031224 RepID=A0A6N8JHG2_9BACT|nr:carboxymuconolactone decarboxylase family protein [Chitinophaga oryziterrae]MVT44745.1 carboxymuconolactone decarboxylase family protein [Chitinophaga oryziterrae]
MEPRINVQKEGLQAMGALYGMGKYLSKSTLSKSFLELIYFRVSQINGCAFCLDMHSKELREMGETEQRLYLLNAWREAPFYTDRERAAFAYAEALTQITSSLVPDEIYNAAKEQFSDAELIDLTIGIIAINSYNRVNIAFGAAVGTYRIGQYA